MRKIILLVFIICCVCNVFADSPYIDSQILHEGESSVISAMVYIENYNYKEKIFSGFSTGVPMSDDSLEANEFEGSYQGSLGKIELDTVLEELENHVKVYGKKEDFYFWYYSAHDENESKAVSISISPLKGVIDLDWTLALHSYSGKEGGESEATLDTYSTTADISNSLQIFRGGPTFTGSNSDVLEGGDFAYWKVTIKTDGLPLDNLYPDDTVFTGTVTVEVDTI